MNWQMKITIIMKRYFTDYDWLDLQSISGHFLKPGRLVCFEYS